MAAILYCAIMLAGCGGATGHIKGAQPDALFVKTAERHYAHSATRNRWIVVGLDGQVHRRLFDGKYSIEDVSRDGRVFVLTNSNTDLFLGFDGGRRIVEIPAFRKLLGAVAISPDGRYIAATKHPDFDLPQKQWVDDNTVYLLDTKTLRSRKMALYENNNNRGAFSLLWLDQRSVRLQIVGGPNQTIDMRTGAHESFPDGKDPLDASPRWKARDRKAESCGITIKPKGPQGDRGFEIHRKGRKPRHLVVVEGRERGFHDYMATISEAFLTRDCRYIVFYFDNGLWVAEVASGKVGPLAPASLQPMLFRRWYPIGLP